MEWLCAYVEQCPASRLTTLTCAFSVNTYFAGVCHYLTNPAANVNSTSNACSIIASAASLLMSNSAAT